MPELKPFKTYDEQVKLLSSRGMAIENEQRAADYLARVSYYRLSGYWHTMRRVDLSTGRSLDEFQSGASETTHQWWLRRFTDGVHHSREEFVTHHRLISVKGSLGRIR